MDGKHAEEYHIKDCADYHSTDSIQIGTQLMIVVQVIVEETNKMFLDLREANKSVYTKRTLMESTRDTDDCCLHL